MAVAPLNGVVSDAAPPPGDMANALAAGVFAGVGPGVPMAFRGAVNIDIWASYTTALTTTAGSLAATVAAPGNIAVGSAVQGANVPPGTTVAQISGNAITLALPTLFFRGKVSAGSRVLAFMPDAGPALIGATVTGYGIPPGTTVVGYTPPPQGPNPSGSTSFGSLTLSQAATLNEPVHAVPYFFAFALAPAAVQGGTDATASFTGTSITYQGSVQVERSFNGGASYLVGNAGSNAQPAVYSGGGPVSTNFAEAERGVVYRLNCTAYTAQAGVILNYRMSETGQAAESAQI